MFQIDELKGAKGLRTFAKDDQLDQAAAELLRRAREIELCPTTLELRQTPDYEDTSEYHLVLWGD